MEEYGEESVEKARRYLEDLYEEDPDCFFVAEVNGGISNTRTVSLTQKHIRGRLAESLLLLVDTYGLEEDGRTIRAYLSREDLANLSNMTTSNAIRTLSTFAAESLISLDGRKISILDMKKLERVSDMG